VQQQENQKRFPKHAATMQIPHYENPDEKERNREVDSLHYWFVPAEHVGYPRKPHVNNDCRSHEQRRIQQSPQERIRGDSLHLDPGDTLQRHARIFERICGLVNGLRTKRGLLAPFSPSAGL